MSLQIIVCIKQVPDPDYFYRITIDPQTGLIDRKAIPSITNPHDRHALEEALRKKEGLGGTVSVLTMGPLQARKSLEDALAVGADRGAIVCDPACQGADTLVTARILSIGVRRLGDFDLILCGNTTADGATGQVPPQLAELLGVPHVTHATDLRLIDKHTAFVTRKIEGGYLKIELQLPAVVSVLKSINTYRLPTAMGIVEAANKEIIEMACCDCEAFGLTSYEMGLKGSPTQVAEIFETDKKRKVEFLQGNPEEMASHLIKKLRQLEAI